VTREVRTAVLGFVGAVLLLVVVQGTVLRYVRPGAAPGVAVAGVVILGLALLDVVRGAAGHGTAGHDTAGKEHEGHDGGHGSGRAAWLLLVPVLVVLLAAPPTLGSEAVDLAGARTITVGRVPDDPLPPGDAPPVALVDLVSRAATIPDGGRLAGHDVTLTGFVVRSRTAPGVDLVRLVVSCCAADATPVRVHLDDPRSLAGEPGGDRWIAARVRLVPGTATPATRWTPTVRVVAADDVPAPAAPYES
jgi:uncharacterized repeat protein (TIGR03943 family)